MNQMELSPNYSGTLRGFTSTFGNITGFVSPLVAGVITKNNVSYINNYFKLIYSNFLALYNKRNDLIHEYI